MGARSAAPEVLVKFLQVPFSLGKVRISPRCSNKALFPEGIAQGVGIRVRELDDLKERTIDALEAIFEAPEPRSDAAIVLDARLTRRLKRQAAHATRFLVDHDAFYHKYLPSRVLRAARRLLKYS